MKKIRENLGTLVTVCTLVVMIVGAQAYFTKASDFNAFKAEYQFDKDTKRYEAVQERLWALEERCSKNPCSPAIINEIKKLKLELKDLERRLSKKG